MVLFNYVRISPNTYCKSSNKPPPQEANCFNLPLRRWLIGGGGLIRGRLFVSPQEGGLLERGANSREGSHWRIYGTHVHTHFSRLMHTYKVRQVGTYLRMYVYRVIRTSVYTYVCICVPTYVRVCTYVRTYVCTCIAL